MENEFKANMIKFSAARMTQFIDLKNIPGHDVSFSYHGLRLFPTSEMNAGSFIGVPALAMLARFGIPASTVAQHLGAIVYAGVANLAHDVSRWSFNVPPQEEERAHAYIAEGTPHERNHRIKSLLCLEERRSSRYLVLDRDRCCSTVDDIAVVCEPFMIVLDALALANRVRTHLAGSLFQMQSIV